jgi:hypothetical protein
MTEPRKDDEAHDEREPAVKPELIKDLDADGEYADDIRGGMPGPNYTAQCGSGGQATR